MVSSRYEGDPNADDDDGADESLSPESVPDGPVASASSPARNRRNELRFEAYRIPENLPFGIVLFDSDQNVLYANPQQAALLNLDIRDAGGIEDWLRQGCRDEAYADRVVNSWREHVWRKQLPRVFSLMSAGEKLREIEFQTKLLENGELLLTLIDVTESRRSEDALRLSESKFHTVFDHMTPGVAVIDRTGRFFEVNPAFEKLVGIGAWRLRRMSLHDLMAREDFILLQQASQELRVNGGNGERSLEARFFRNGCEELVAMKVTLSPIWDSGRELHFTVCFVEEIVGDGDENEGIRRSLRESQEQNRALLEATPDLILLLDRSGEIRDLFPPAEDWDETPAGLGSAWVGSGIASRWPEFGEPAGSAIFRALEGGSVESLKFSSLDRRAHYRARLARCGEEEVVAVIADDTREWKAREALARQGAVFQHLGDGIILTDLKGRVIDCNPAAEKSFGYSAAEMAGEGLARLYEAPEKRENFNHRLTEALNRSGQWKASTAFYRKDGSTGFADVLYLPVTEEDGCPPFSILGLHHEIVETPIDDDGGERIQHRFRNQLQTVSSLFGLEFGDEEGGASASMLEKFQARLRAITRIHELADRNQENESGSVCLFSLTQLLADDLVRIHGVASGMGSPISVFGDDRVRENLERATPFGLLIAELGVAALCNRDRLGLADEGARNGIGFLIQPCDDGSSQLIASGPGKLFEGISETILNCLAGQLRGKLEGASRDGRSEIRVRFPFVEN